MGLGIKHTKTGAIYSFNSGRQLQHKLDLRIHEKFTPNPYQTSPDILSLLQKQI